MKDDISYRIKKAIDKSGYTLIKLQEMTGIPKSAIQRYATGDTEKLPIDRVEKIALATNVSPAYLMGWDDEDKMLSGVNKVATLVIDLNDNSFSYYKLDLKKIVYSGIFELFKKNSNEYYKWHYETISKLDTFVKTINESIEFTFDQDLPMIFVNKKHFKLFSRDFLNDIIYQKEGVQNLLDMLEKLSVMNDKEIKNLYNELENPTNKKQILENEYSTYDFSTLSDEEIEKYYERYLEVVKLESEKFKKILCIK